MCFEQKGKGYLKSILITLSAGDSQGKLKEEVCTALRSNTLRRRYD